MAAAVLMKKDFLYIFCEIRKPESISWLRSQRRRKHMKEERRKWNARELFLMIEEELRTSAYIHDNRKGRNTFWKNYDMMYSKMQVSVFVS